jgi:hypothetical protein
MGLGKILGNIVKSLPVVNRITRLAEAGSAALRGDFKAAGKSFALSLLPVASAVERFSGLFGKSTPASPPTEAGGPASGLGNLLKELAPKLKEAAKKADAAWDAGQPQPPDNRQYYASYLKNDIDSGHLPKGADSPENIELLMHLRPSDANKTLQGWSAGTIPVGVPVANQIPRGESAAA